MCRIFVLSRSVRSGNLTIVSEIPDFVLSPLTNKFRIFYLLICKVSCFHVLYKNYWICYSVWKWNFVVVKHSLTIWNFEKFININFQFNFWWFSWFSSFRVSNFKWNIEYRYNVSDLVSADSTIYFKSFIIHYSQSKLHRRWLYHFQCFSHLSTSQISSKKW